MTKDKNAGGAKEKNKGKRKGGGVDAKAGIAAEAPGIDVEAVSAVGIPVAVMSDLHNEFERHGPSRPTSAWFSLAKARKSIQNHPSVGPDIDFLRGSDVELVVMAGDIDVGVEGVAYAGKVSDFLGVPVVYVPGNHEGYGGRDLSFLIPEMRAAAAAGPGRTHVLENEEVVLDLPSGRLRVFGCVLWTDYGVNGTSEVAVAHAMNDAGNGLNDHRRIRLDGAKLSPSDARRLHAESIFWLEGAFARAKAEDPEGKILVVTHHAPVPDANPPQYRGGPLSPAFASDLRPLLAKWGPAAWIYGHTHHSFDEVVEGVRVVSSQRGYVCAEPGADEYVPAVIRV